MRRLRRTLAAIAAGAMLGLRATLAYAAPAVVEDIRDIRAPVLFPPWWRWPAAAAAAALLALAVVLATRRWRRRRASAASPLERARAALATANDLALAGRCREWAEIVAETLRGALAIRLGASVLVRTTSELASAAWVEAALPGHEDGQAPDNEAPVDGRRVLEVLQACDLARFALADLGREQMRSQTALALAMVEGLLAAPAPPTPAAAPTTTPRWVTS